MTDKKYDHIYTVCLTGGAGSGKSLISRMLKGMGYTVLDSDSITREQVMRPGCAGFDGIVDFFGREILDREGEIDRKKLALIVFADEEKLAKLNSITHPATVSEINTLIRAAEKNGEKLIFVESAIPFVADFDSFCDEFWYIRADKEERIGRLMASRGYSREKAESIFASQPPESLYLEKCKRIIDNPDNADFEQTEKRIKEIIEDILA